MHWNIFIKKNLPNKNRNKVKTRFHSEKFSRNKVRTRFPFETVRFLTLFLALFSVRFPNKAVNKVKNKAGTSGTTVA